MAATVDDRRRKAYLQATTLSQAMLDETFLGGENQIESVGILTKTVGVTTYTLRFADQPKYVGDDFYEGRAQFPQVKRTIGELQSPSLQFSQFEVVLGNVDGFYNAYLEGGASYFPFIGARLQIKLGLRDVSGSFITVFDGFVPDQGGFDVSRESITIRANDRFDILNTKVPLPTINDTDFPSAPADNLGKVIPLALGDWTIGFNVTDSQSTIDVGGQVVNVSSPGVFYGGLIGYNVGSTFFVFSIGNYTPDNILKCYVKRGDALMQTNFTAVPDNTAGYWSVNINTLDGSSGTVAYAYQSGDVAVISVKVPYTGTSYDNPIKIAQETLLTLTDLSTGDLETSSWNALIAKASPPSADMTSLKARIWVGEDKDNVLDTVLGFLEQFRVEMYVDVDGLIALKAIHTDEFVAQASLLRIEQVEINEESVKIKADERTFFNQALVNYAFTPVTKKTMLSTVQKLNQDSIDKSGKRVIKAIDCPWICVQADAELQLIEFLRLYSTGLSFLEIQVAWIHLLKDLGSFIGLNYNIGSLSYDNAPMQIRDIDIDLGNGGVTFKLLSLANFAYTGYAPSNSARFLSGASQSIVDA